MCGPLALLFIAVPAIEIYALIEVGSHIGALATLAIIVATGVLGAALARQQGLSALREVQRSFATGSDVGRSVVEALLVLCASVMLLTPGFFTDVIGFALLLPPIRRVVATGLVKRFAGRAHNVVIGGMPGGGEFGPGVGWTGPGGRDERTDGRGYDDDDLDDDLDTPPPGVIDV